MPTAYPPWEYEPVECSRPRADGQDVWAAAYPYTAGSSTLVSLLPASELDGGMDALRRILAEPAERGRLVSHDRRFLDRLMLDRALTL